MVMTVPVEGRLLIAFATFIVLLFLYHRLRYVGFLAFAIGSGFNVLVKYSIWVGFVLLGDATHGNMVALQDLGYLIAAVILLYDFTRADKIRP